MNLPAKLAMQQLKNNRKRTIWTLIGIVLSVAMITAVYGFAASGIEAVYGLTGELRDEYVATFVAIGTLLSLIIVSASIIVMSNSFRVSAGERTRQFGILKSTGATKQQIARIVMHEARLLSLVGIPVGILVGLAVQFSGLQIANHLVGDIRHISEGFVFVIAWQAILASIAIAIVTVMLSAWLPARKAAKVPAIDAIRGTGEVKLKAKEVRSGWLVRTIFGFEGSLASKSLKRSRRNFRATVVSLTISIILFIGASSFGAHINRMASVVINTTNADVLVYFDTSATWVVVPDEEDWDIGEMTAEDILERLPEYEAIYSTISIETAETILARLREFPGATVMGAGAYATSFWGFSSALPQNMISQTLRNVISENNLRDGYATISITLVHVDAETYAELCRRAGVPLGSNILMNYMRWHVDGRWMEFMPIVFDYQTVPTQYQGEVIEVPLHGVLSGDQIPMEVLHTSRAHFSGGIAVIVPPFDSPRYHWFAQVDDSSGFAAFAHEVLDELLPQNFPTYVNANVQDMSANERAERAIIRLVMVFIYGFVGMLTLIGLTNVISTISTNVRSRAREFAVLQSVGMTHGGLNRMLNLESILCSMRSLIIGLPLGIAVSYGIYQSILYSVHFDYIFPWVAVVQCVLAVFVITWVTMRFAAARLRGENIVETIRGV